MTVLALCSVGGAVLALNVSGLRDLLFAKHRNNVGLIHSIAVLPLVNLSGDAAQEYFADGMTESLITEMGRVSSSQVISRQSVMQYKGSKKSLQEIASELKVDAVLEGAVQRSGDQLRVTVHLSQALPERQLWAQEYNRSLRDVLSLQGEIASAVADEIHAKLTPEEQIRLTSATAVDPEAHDDYLRGRYLLGLTIASHSRFTDQKKYGENEALEAIGQFKQAIVKDPGFALAYAGLADAYIVLGDPASGGHPPRAALSDAKAAATRALELDPSLAEVHFSLAQTLEYDWNWPEAEKEYRLAVKLNPNDADARGQYGRFLQALGRNDEAFTTDELCDSPRPVWHQDQGVRGLRHVCIAAIRQGDKAIREPGR
jgi:TolB-like protein